MNIKEYYRGLLNQLADSKNPVQVRIERPSWSFNGVLQKYEHQRFWSVDVPSQFGSCYIEIDQIVGIRIEPGRDETLCVFIDLWPN